MLLPPSPSLQSFYQQIQNVIYLITFSGTYYVQNGADVKKFEPVTLRMNQAQVNEGPMSVFKNEFAPIVFPRQYPDFKLLHKWRIDTSVREDGGPILDLNLMNRGEITSVISRENLPINVSLYKNVEALREALIRYVQDQTGFAQEQAFKEKTLNKTARVAASFMDLNKDLFEIVRADEAAELQNKIINQPRLMDILATKNAIDNMSNQSEWLAAEVNTTGMNLGVINQQHMVPTLQPRGYIENAAQDTFPDGTPTIGGKPIKNPSGTNPNPPSNLTGF